MKLFPLGWAAVNPSKYLPHHTMPFPDLPYFTLPYPFIPCATLPYPAIPRPTLKYEMTPKPFLIRACPLLGPAPSKFELYGPGPHPVNHQVMRFTSLQVMSLARTWWKGTLSWWSSLFRVTGRPFVLQAILSCYGARFLVTGHPLVVVSASERYGNRLKG